MDILQALEESRSSEFRILRRQRWRRWLGGSQKAWSPAASVVMTGMNVAGRLHGQCLLARRREGAERVGGKAEGRWEKEGVEEE